MPFKTPPELLAKRREWNRNWRAAHPSKAAEYNATYLRRHPDRVRAKAAKWRLANGGYSRESHLRRRYGITVADYNAMLTEQHGVCAICCRPPIKRRLAVDHDHITGRVRGLLCLGCNRGIGLLAHSPESMVAAIDYLKRHAPVAIAA